MLSRNFDWEKMEVDWKSVMDIIEIHFACYNNMTRTEYLYIIERYKK